jgi:hypothetical protein
MLLALPHVPTDNIATLIDDLKSIVCDDNKEAIITTFQRLLSSLAPETIDLAPRTLIDAGQDVENLILQYYGERTLTRRQKNQILVYVSQQLFAGFTPGPEVIRNTYFFYRHNTSNLGIFLNDYHPRQSGVAHIDIYYGDPNHYYLKDGMIELDAGKLKYTNLKAAPPQEHLFSLSEIPRLSG